jgi:hypothetical protein
MANKNGNPQNLKPFQKGKDTRRNTKGAPKKLPALDELIADVLGEENNGIEAAKAILLVQRNKAIKGDLRAAEWLFDRGYGRAKQEIKHDLDTNVEGFKIEVKRNRDDSAV